MSPERDVLVKAAPLRAVQGFLQDELTPDGRAGVLEKAAREFPLEVERMGRPVIASDRFPVVFVNRLIELAAEERRQPATAIAHRIGRRGAEEASSGILRLAMVLISMESLFRKLSPVWSQLYTHGEMKVATSPRKATITLENFPVVSRTGCARITGWFEWFAQKAEKTATVTHAACRADGAKECRWDATW